jgi:tetratricopeptide (TPR) repeat protein
MDLTYFNPNSQKEADFIASFVARQDTLDFFMKQLSLVPTGQAARHHLIVAPRGFGKTSLLRRIAIGVNNDVDLHARFIPLRFREEQHNVISLDVLWRNCLQSLLEAREDEGAAQSELDELDAAWEAHAPRQSLPRDGQDGEPAWHALRTRCEALQRRPVLLIDNLDTLLAGLSAHHQWGLRKRLQADDGPVLIAAASRYPEATHNPEAAFYEFFRIQTLDRLDNQEVFTCLRNIATHRGDAGKQVLNLLDTEPGRVAALNTMAGGNPRTLSVLYGVLESHMSGDVLSQLSAMLDTFTGWYQARTEELPMQARAVFDALALNWDPMTAAALGLATGLDTPAVSSQLSRLEKSGYVETVALSKRKTGRTGYQVSERFFNIWYLMRNGPRRAKQSIRFLTTFLQSCFSATERRTMARAALLDQDVDPSYVLALATGLGYKKLRASLLQHAIARSNQAGQMSEYLTLASELRIEWGIEEQARTTKPTLLNLELHLAALSILLTGLKFEDLGDHESSIKRYDEFFARFSAASESQLQETVAQSLVFKTSSLRKLSRLEQAVEVCDVLVQRFEASNEINIRESVATALLGKVHDLSTLGRTEEAINVCDEIVVKFGAATELPLREWVALALVYKGFLLRTVKRLEQSISAYDEVVTRFGRARETTLRQEFAQALFGKGVCLQELNQLDASDLAYRDALKEQPATGSIYVRLGSLLLDLKGEPDQARLAYESGLKMTDQPKTKALLHANLAYLLVLFADDPNGAEKHWNRATSDDSDLSAAGRFLLDALSEFAKLNNAGWHLAFEAIGKAVSSEDSTLWSDYSDDLGRLLWHIVAKGKGADFKQWMEVHNYPAQYAPLYHAFVAALEGEDHLLQINPETREPASKIYAGIARRLKLYGTDVERKRPPKRLA